MSEQLHNPRCPLCPPTNQEFEVVNCKRDGRLVYGKVIFENEIIDFVVEKFISGGILDTHLLKKLDIFNSFHLVKFIESYVTRYINMIPVLV